MGEEMKSLIEHNSILETHLNTVNANHDRHSGFDWHSEAAPSPESESDHHSMSMPFDHAHSLIAEMTDTNNGLWSHIIALEKAIREKDSKIYSLEHSLKDQKTQTQM